MNVETDRLRFTFSEPVDEASFRTAFSIAPEMNGAIDFRGSGRTVEVRLPEALRASTTYRVTLDVSLRDRRSVTLDAPITLAFATGSEIDRGRLSGRILQARDGQPAAGVDVLAFASADSTDLNEGPLYRTQTGSDGRFRLEYLSEGSYFVVGLEDDNRNRQIDTGEALAVPPQAAIPADTSMTAVARPWVLARFDESAPTVERVRAISTGELEIRLSEPLAWRLDDAIAPPENLFVVDSLRSRSVRVDALWFSQNNPRIIYGAVEELAPGSWTMEGVFAAADSSGNELAPSQQPFSVSPGLPPPDPVTFLSWTPDSLGAVPAGDDVPATFRVVWPFEAPGVRLSGPTVDSEITFVDSSGIQMAFQVDYSDPAAPKWYPDVRGRFTYKAMLRIAEDDSTHAIWLRTATERDMGALGLVVEAGEFDPEEIVGILWRTRDSGPSIATTSLEGDMLLFEELSGGFRGRALVFVDQDGDGTWSPGSLLPYRAAEPVGWHAFGEPVRPRWDTIAADTLRLAPLMIPGMAPTEDVPSQE